MRRCPSLAVTRPGSPPRRRCWNARLRSIRTRPALACSRTKRCRRALGWTDIATAATVAEQAALRRLRVARMLGIRRLRGVFLHAPARPFARDSNGAPAHRISSGAGLLCNGRVLHRARTDAMGGHADRQSPRDHSSRLYGVGDYAGRRPELSGSDRPGQRGDASTRRPKRRHRYGRSPPASRSPARPERLQSSSTHPNFDRHGSRRKSLEARRRSRTFLEGFSRAGLDKSATVMRSTASKGPPNSAAYAVSEGGF